MTDSFAGLQAAGNLGADVNNWTSAPYYFVRGGIVFQSSDSLRHAGHSHYSGRLRLSLIRGRTILCSTPLMVQMYPRLIIGCLATSVRCLAR